MALLGPIGLPGGPPTPIPTKPLGPVQKSILSGHGGPLHLASALGGSQGVTVFFIKPISWVPWNFQVQGTRLPYYLSS